MKVLLILHHFVKPVWPERDFGGMNGVEFPDLFVKYAVYGNALFLVLEGFKFSTNEWNKSFFPSLAKSLNLTKKSCASVTSSPLSIRNLIKKVIN